MRKLIHLTTVNTLPAVVIKWDNFELTPNAFSKCPVKCWSKLTEMVHLTPVRKVLRWNLVPGPLRTGNRPNLATSSCHKVGHFFGHTSSSVQSTWELSHARHGVNVIMSGLMAIHPAQRPDFGQFARDSQTPEPRHVTHQNTRNRTGFLHARTHFCKK